MANYAGLKRAARHFDVSRSLLYKLEAEGQIKFYEGLGNRVLVDMDELSSKVSIRQKRPKEIQSI